MSKFSTLLLGRVRHLTPGYSTERDGGDWYICTPGGCDRIGEGFADRDDARRLLCWLAGDPAPDGWRLVSVGSLYASLYVDDFPTNATIWLAPTRERFANAAALNQL